MLTSCDSTEFLRMYLSLDHR